MGQVTADRKRKLQDVQSGLTLLGLCPLLVHIWEKVRVTLRVRLRLRLRLRLRVSGVAFLPQWKRRRSYEA